MFLLLSVSQLHDLLLLLQVLVLLLSDLLALFFIEYLASISSMLRSSRVLLVIDMDSMQAIVLILFLPLVLLVFTTKFILQSRQPVSVIWPTFFKILFELTQLIFSLLQLVLQVFQAQKALAIFMLCYSQLKSIQIDKYQTKLLLFQEESCHILLLILL